MGNCSGYQSEKDSPQPTNRHNDNDNDDVGLLYASTRDEGFGIEVKRRIMLGTFTLTAG